MLFLCSSAFLLVASLTPTAVGQPPPSLPPTPTHGVVEAALDAAPPNWSGLLLMGSDADRADFWSTLEPALARSAELRRTWGGLVATPMTFVVGRGLRRGQNPDRGNVKFDGFEYGLVEGDVRSMRGVHLLDLDDLEALPLASRPNAPQAEERGEILIHAFEEAQVGWRSKRVLPLIRYTHAHRAATEADARYRAEQGQPAQSQMELVQHEGHGVWRYIYEDGSCEDLEWHQGALVQVSYGTYVRRHGFLVTEISCER
jgi:hypothetical protein